MSQNCAISDKYEPLQHARVCVHNRGARDPPSAPPSLPCARLGERPWNAEVVSHPQTAVSLGVSDAARPFGSIDGCISQKAEAAPTTGRPKSVAMDLEENVATATPSCRNPLCVITGLCRHSFKLPCGISVAIATKVPCRCCGLRRRPNVRLLWQFHMLRSSEIWLWLHE